MRLKFEIDKQHIYRTDNEIPVNKSHEYLEAEFEFLTPEWEDLIKIVLFKIPLSQGKEKSYAIQLDPSTDYIVTVPWEVLQGRVFKVSVFAGDLVTSNEAVVLLEESGYTTDISSTTDPTPDIFAEIFRELSTKSTDDDLQAMMCDLARRINRI